MNVEILARIYFHAHTTSYARSKCAKEGYEIIFVDDDARVRNSQAR
jgi:hypothetical protein